MSKSKTDAQRDTRLHNTRRLLHAMGGGLREHIEQSVVSAEELEDLEIMSMLCDRDPDVHSNAFVRSKTLSEILLVNAERLYNAWECSSKNGSHRRRCRIIREWYFLRHTLKEISKDLGKSENEVLSQLSIALDELSVYFFGDGGLSDISRVTAKNVLRV